MKASVNRIKVANLSVSTAGRGHLQLSLWKTYQSWAVLHMSSLHWHCQGLTPDRQSGEIRVNGGEQEF